MDQRSNVTKPLILALMAVLAFSAFAASAAQALAPRVQVKDAEGNFNFLKAGDFRNFEATSTTEGKLTTPFFGLTLKNDIGECAATGKLSGSNFGEPNGASGKLICEDVEVEGGGVCAARSEGQEELGVIETNELGGKAVWLDENGERIGGLFQEPPEGFVTVLIEDQPGTEECALFGKYPVTGEVIGEIGPETPGCVEKFEEGTIDFPAPPILTWWNNAEPREEQSIAGNRLRFGNQPTTFDSTFKFNLTPKEEAAACAG